MPKINLEFPQIGLPVGSLEELKVLHEDLPYHVGSCSKPEYMKNKGCAKWGDCEFPWKGTRPQEVVCEINKPDGSFRVSVCHCRDAIQLQQQIAENRGYVRFAGGEGTKYLLRGTRRKHPVVDSTCPECVKGVCQTHEEWNEPRTVPKFPKAEDYREGLQYPLRKFASRRDVAELRRTEESVLSERQYYGKIVNEPVAAKEAKDGQDAQPAGSGPGDRGQRGGGKGPAATP